MALIELASRTPQLSALIELACYDASCRPPTSGGTGGSSPVGVISTRVPKTVGAESQVHGLSTILSDVPHAAVHGQAMAMIKKVPGFGHYKDHPGAKKGASEADQRAMIDAMVDQVADNVVEVYDRSPNPEVTRRWYDAANSLSVDLAAEFGIDYEETAAVIAALSPSADWESNVALARHVLEVTTGPKALSAADVKAINRTAVQQYDKALASWQKNRMDKALASGKPESIAKAEASRPKPPAKLNHETVTSMDDLSDTQMAYLVRIRAGADGVPVQRMLLADKDGAPLVRPDGSVGYDLSQRATNNDGSNTKIRWQSYPNMANAVSVIRDPSVENVSARLSQQHKVRSFYNNIAHPNSDQLDVTMDTHAFGIAFRIPVTVGHSLIASGPGGVYGTPSNAAAGTSGIHVMLGEGYRRAATRVNARTGKSKPKRPLLPREMQSVTWEQWRYDYPKETRTRKGTTQTTYRTEEIIKAADADPVSWPPDRISAELAKVREAGS